MAPSTRNTSKRNSVADSTASSASSATVNNTFASTTNSTDNKGPSQRDRIGKTDHSRSPSTSRKTTGQAGREKTANVSLDFSIVDDDDANPSLQTAAVPQLTSISKHEAQREIPDSQEQLSAVEENFADNGTIAVDTARHVDNNISHNTQTSVPQMFASQGQLSPVREESSSDGDRFVARTPRRADITGHSTHGGVSHPAQDSSPEYENIHVRPARPVDRNVEHGSQESGFPVPSAARLPPINRPQRATPGFTPVNAKRAQNTTAGWTPINRSELQLGEASAARGARQYNATLFPGAYAEIGKEKKDAAKKAAKNRGETAKDDGAGPTGPRAEETAAIVEQTEQDEVMSVDGPKSDVSGSHATHVIASDQADNKHLKAQTASTPSVEAQPSAIATAANPATANSLASQQLEHNGPSRAMHEAISNGQKFKKEQDRSGATKEQLAHFVMADNKEDILEGTVFIPKDSVVFISQDKPATWEELHATDKVIVLDEGRLDTTGYGEGIVVDHNGCIVGTFRDVHPLNPVFKNGTTQRQVAFHDGLTLISGDAVSWMKRTQLGELFDHKKAVRNAAADTRAAMQFLGMNGGRNPGPEAIVDNLKKAAKAHHNTIHSGSSAADSASTEGASRPPRQLGARQPAQNGTRVSSLTVVPEENATNAITLAANVPSPATPVQQNVREKARRKYQWIIVEPNEFDTLGKPLLDVEGKHTPFVFEVGKDQTPRLTITRKHKVTGQTDTSIRYPKAVDWNNQGDITRLNSWRAQYYRRNVENYARYEPRLPYSAEEKAFLRQYWANEMASRADAGAKANWAAVAAAFAAQFPDTPTKRTPSSISAWCGRDPETNQLRGRKGGDGGRKRKAEAMEDEEEGADAVSMAGGLRALRKPRRAPEGGEEGDELW